MAYTAGNLHLRAGAPGDLTYTYDAGSDAMATVATAGYFNNTDDDLNLTVDDLIWCQCTDGNMWQRVSAISSGSVTTQFAGGNLPIQTPATGTAAALGAAMSVGQYEIGSAIATASRLVLPTPYPGAEVLVRKTDSGTMTFFLDAGGSATGGATGVTYDSVGNRRFVLQQEGEMFHVVGSSTSRWRIKQAQTHASIAGSVTLGGGASRFPGGT
jgi:hypothetical protein